MSELAWKAVSGYIRGLSHIEYDEPCQDRALNKQHDGMEIIVLCDGAGSCKYSEQGAIAVTNAMANVTSAQFDEWYTASDTSILLEQFLLEKLEQEVKQIQGSTLLDFSCTLLFSIVKENRFLAGHVGDGVICQRYANELSILSYPENGRYANETYFITMTPLGDHFRIYKGEIDKPIDFLLLSDGAAVSFYLAQNREMESENTLMLLDHLVENEIGEVGSELIGLLEIVRNNTSDDCAVAVMVSHQIGDITTSFNMEDDDHDDPDIRFNDDSELEEQSDAVQENITKNDEVEDLQVTTFDANLNANQDVEEDLEESDKLKDTDRFVQRQFLQKSKVRVLRKRLKDKKVEF